ncbi:molybdenum ABC transporter ATP-binding protein [Acidovorax sp. GW101-3H11]|uniref:molybdenum ABC transporter ATP-binding protein n=2 Tax=Pseudomonadota TaxID=1224 RepID=UPI0007B508B2|nr:molybdenum ABC transporter ATP-binding protein [Acidovorax sp. GW101-3H11]KZT13885.1 molybdenum ABC transporter ATP-binding protein [Acidovorax sp. GW101-3H11]
METAPPLPSIDARLHLARPGFTLNVDLHLPGRGVTALFGPSGCGKTTCLRAIAGLTRNYPDTGLTRNRPNPGLARAQPGRVVVNGEVWQDDAAKLWRATHERALGYVFQEASLFDHLNVRGNITYGLQRTPPARRQVALEQAVELLGIGHLMERKPQALSGGERQRVAIARALATSPRLLLMDEPLAALDAQRKAEVLPYLEKLHRALDIPVLYVSHAIDEVARLASHMVLLREGRVLAQGPTGELITRLDLPLAHGDAAATVIEGTVQQHDARDHITTVGFSGGQLLLVSPTARAPGEALRLRVQARDVSLALAAPSDSSILNILPATVVAVAEDSPGQCMVALDAGATRLLARVTQRSAQALALAPGRAVFAQVKGVAIVN